MKILTQTNTVPFGLVPIGYVFNYRGHLFMKTHVFNATSDMLNSVDLTENKLKYFGHETEVVPVKSAHMRVTL